MRCSTICLVTFQKVDIFRVRDKIYIYKKDGDIYFINHGTIQAFAKKYGWENLRTLFIKMGIGIKVIDEYDKPISKIWIKLIPSDNYLDYLNKIKFIPHGKFFAKKK